MLPTYVFADATLTIDAGVVVKFNPDTNADLFFFGKLIANGTTTDPIYFTSNSDDGVGGSTDDEEDCYYEDYDEDGIPIGDAVCDIVDYYDPLESDWDGIYFRDSSGSILNNVFIRYADDAVSMVSSSATFTNLNIKDSSSGLFIYNDSHANISSGVFSYLSDNFAIIFNSSSIILNDASISNTTDGILSYQSSSVDMTDSSISCSNDGVYIYDHSSLNISGGTISCLHDGVILFNEVATNITGAKVTNALDAGVVIYGNTSPTTISITKSEITANEYGFLVWNSVFSAHQNSIHGNFTKGVETYPIVDPPHTDLDMTSNFWGDKTGPTHPTNSLGLGDPISSDIIFTPFLLSDPLKAGLSNVMFIPGFQASRMYKMTDNDVGSYYENKLWEPASGNSDVSLMYMDSNGESIDDGVYTRDVIDEAVVFGLDTLNFYKSFFGKLNDMVSNNEISAWKPIAYDWRLSPLDIVEKGVESGDGKISYNTRLTSVQVPYIIEQLQELVDSSGTGKVTIVTHSNGGLVAKALIAKLLEMKSEGKSNLIDSIDNLIAVAPPMAGTPKAFLGILHGYDQGVLANMLLSRKNARDFGQNIPGAYGLLPSEEYMSDINSNLIYFDESLNKINNWREKYGESIGTFTQFKNFLLDLIGGRAQPDHDDLASPTILNEAIFNKAKLLHDKIDNLVIPETIKVHQVAGFGLPTAYNLRYRSKPECIIFGIFCSKKKLVLSSDAGFTSAGDGTVVSDSALFGDGEDYYLNLKQYNKDRKKQNFFYSTKDHVNIFEIPYIFNLVENILKKDSNLPEYFTEDKPSPVNYTILKMRSPVAIDIYDSDGLHTGETEENIPNSLYMEIGEEKYIAVPSDGVYSVRLTGLSDGIFTLEQQQIVNDLPSESVTFRSIDTTSLLRGEASIASNSLVSSISLDKNGDGIFESSITPTDLSISEDLEGGIIQRSSSGSYMSQLAIINQPIFSTEGPIYKPIVIDESIVESNLNNAIIDTMSETPIYKEVLGASVGGFYDLSYKEIKIQLLIIGVFALLLISLKFIFKLI